MMPLIHTGFSNASKKHYRLASLFSGSSATEIDTCHLAERMSVYLFLTISMPFLHSAALPITSMHLADAFILNYIAFKKLCGIASAMLYSFSHSNVTFPVFFYDRVSQIGVCEGTSQTK